ncbi:hypothetical protein LTR93_012312, partial [Exophiala xenobiotica]
MSGENTSVSKKRRLRFGKACHNCRWKKNRCDGAKPACYGCRSRGLECEYNIDDTHVPPLESLGPQEAPIDQPGSGDRGSEDVEPLDWRSISGIVITSQQPSTTCAIGSLLTDPNAQQSVDSLATCKAAPVDSRQGEENATGTLNPVPHEAANADGTNLARMNGYFGPSSSFDLVSKCRSDKQVQDDTGVRLKGSSPGTTISSESPFSSGPFPGGSLGQYAMPPQEYANKLVDAYFERVHVLYPFLHERSFRARYEQLWVSHSQQQVQTKPSWLAVANLVF